MESWSQEILVSTAHLVNPTLQFQSLVPREKEQSTFQQPSHLAVGIIRGSLSKSGKRTNASIFFKDRRRPIHVDFLDGNRAEETSCQRNSPWDPRRNHRSRSGTISRLRSRCDSGESHAYFFV